MFPYHHWQHVSEYVDLIKKNIAGFTRHFMVDKILVSNG